MTQLQNWASLKKKLQQRLEKSRRRLFNTRTKRVHPFKNDKILTGWNGLMIAALAETQYTAAAEKASKFILRNMQDEHLRALGIDPQKAMLALHIKDENRKIRSEIDAYILLLCKVPLLRPLAWLIGFR